MYVLQEAIGRLRQPAEEGIYRLADLIVELIYHRDVEKAVE